MVFSLVQGKNSEYVKLATWQVLGKGLFNLQDLVMMGFTLWMRELHQECVMV